MSAVSRRPLLLLLESTRHEDVWDQIQSYNRHRLGSLNGKTVGLDRGAGAGLFCCLVLALDLRVRG
jgi:hypothetical protein